MRNMIRVLVVVVLAACAQMELSQDESDICTISDCPEGVTLAQMRSQTVTEAYDAGADTVDRLSCMRANANVRCYAWWTPPLSSRELRLTCTWSGCDEQDNCDTFEGCVLD